MFPFRNGNFIRLITDAGWIVMTFLGLSIDLCIERNLTSTRHFSSCYRRRDIEKELVFKDSLFFLWNGDGEFDIGRRTSTIDLKHLFVFDKHKMFQNRLGNDDTVTGRPSRKGKFHLRCSGC